MSDHNSSASGIPEPSVNGTPLHLPFTEEEQRCGNWQLKAIQTIYKGYRFRSRLEARWAVFFDTLTIEWCYEPEGFILAPFGEWYLPDFYLPELGYWIEVKPQEPNKEAQRKAYLFNYGLARDDDPAKRQKRAFIIHGDVPWPYPKEGNIVGFSANHAPEGDATRRNLCWQMCPVCQKLVIGQINKMSCRACVEELGLLVEDALNVVEGIPEFDKVVDIIPAMVDGAVSTEFFRSGYKSSRLREAYGKARGARFEFGEGKQRSSA